MNFINSWRKGNKQDDKFLVWIRFGRITAFKIYMDFSSSIFEITILNFGIKTKQMYSYGQIECLNQEQSELVVKQIEELQRYWIPRGTSQYPDVHMYTLGVASYLDCKPVYGRYKEGIQVFNPILKTTFDWMYSIIIQKIE